MLWSAQGLIMVVYILHKPFFNYNAFKLQAVLNAAARLIGAPQSFPISPFSSETPFIGFLYVSSSTSRSASSSLVRNSLCGSAPQYLKVYLSQFLLYLVAPPIGLRLGSLGCPSVTNV